jgi:hypothetical protein
MTTPSTAMPPARRRPIPGMTAPTSRPTPTPTSPAPSTASTPPPALDADRSSVIAAAAAALPAVNLAASPVTARRPPRPTRPAATSTPDPGEASPSAAAAARRRSVDYAATRLVNFRLPVDLHDSFRALVREAEERHPRLRRPSLA